LYGGCTLEGLILVKHLSLTFVFVSFDSLKSDDAVIQNKRWHANVENIAQDWPEIFFVFNLA